MKETITFELPEGKTYKKTIDENGKLIIEIVDVEPIRSKSWEEFCKNHPEVDGEFYLNGNGSISTHRSSITTRGTLYDKNLLSSKEDAEGILALIQLTRLHDEWVGDWRHDGKKDVDTIYINSANCPSILKSWGYFLLQFPTREMAEEFITCFSDLIIIAKRFI